MPIKGGEFTVQEAEFVRFCVETADPVKAADMAGYARPTEAANRLALRPEVQAAVSAAVSARLRVEGYAVGVKVLTEIATDPKAPKAPRVQAAAKLIDYSRDGTAPGAHGSLSEMSRAQLDEARAKALAYLHSLDNPPVLELEAQPAPPAGLFD